MLLIFLLKDKMLSFSVLVGVAKKAVVGSI